jgi:hypothetical protein
MVDQVWISEVTGDSTLGNKLGLRHKWFGEPWEAPYVHHFIPDRGEKSLAAVFRAADGLTVKREDMPEASAVYSMPHFKRCKDVFWLGGFLAVKGRVADVLAKFEFGEGGGLVPYTIYEADEKTPLPGPFYIVNFGPQKDCLLPGESTNVKELAVHHETGLTHWTIRYVSDGDVALSPAALDGADIWKCPRVSSCIFMSNRLVEALNAAAVKVDFRLHRCRIVELN